MIIASFIIINRNNHNHSCVHLTHICIIAIIIVDRKKKRLIIFLQKKHTQATIEHSQWFWNDNRLSSSYIVVLVYYCYSLSIFFLLLNQSSLWYQLPNTSTHTHKQSKFVKRIIIIIISRIRIGKSVNLMIFVIRWSFFFVHHYDSYYFYNLI